MKKLLLMIVAISTPFVFSFASVSAQGTAPAPTTPAPATGSGSKAAICEGVGLTGGNCDAPSGTSIDKVLKTAIDLISILVGVAAVIMIMIGGFKYVTSQGDSGNIQSAKNTILYAIIGLVVVALAQVIVAFVLNEVNPTPAPATSAPTTPVGP
jgi:uncharacterized membrane protein YidH (DUF202 family)